MATVIPDLDRRHTSTIRTVGKPFNLGKAQKAGIRQECSLLPVLFHIVLEVSVNASDEKITGTKNEKEEIKLCLFTDCINARISPEKRQKMDNVMRYKIDK